MFLDGSPDTLHVLSTDADSMLEHRPALEKSWIPPRNRNSAQFH